MDTSRSALADRFAATLEAGVPAGRAVARLAEYGAAFDEAAPSLVTSPRRRAELRDAIGELESAGVVRASRTQDRSERPSLPTELTLLWRDADPVVGRETAAFPWRPELAWAAGLPLRRTEFEALKAIQAHLRDMDDDEPIVPVGERSLAIFGNEKRLARLAKGERLFGPGRLSMELLRAQTLAPPFVFRHVGPGRVVLVLENQATYHSVLATLPPGSPVGLVVFGSGANFVASVAYLAELPTDAGIAQTFTAIRYFGDLDRQGLAIPLAADRVARGAGLPAVQPADGLWELLLDHGVRQRNEAVAPDVAARVAAWLPSRLRAAASDILIGGERMAQEAVGTRLLGSHRDWATWPGLGRDEDDAVGASDAGGTEPTL